MARLPVPGGDNGNWGAVLNDFLLQLHQSDGTFKDNVITSAAIAPDAIDAIAIADGSITNTLISDGTIQESKLATSVQTKLNSVAGTPDWGTITNKPVVIASGANQAAARASIGAGTSNLAIGTTSTTAKAGDYTPTKADVGLGSVDNTSDATKNSAVATLTNKTLDNSNTITLKDTNLTLQDDGDVTKQAKVQLAGITAGTTRTYTLPDASGTVALMSALPPIRFSAPTAVLGVSPTDYAYGPRTLTGARMRVSSAPVGSALVAEVQHWDGYTWIILATLTIANGSVTDAVASFSQAQVAGNMVRINCTSVGATTAATGVAVDVTV